ncbi:2Fe-2S iron-sulfur cluster binding domain-containing protein [Halorubellus sp. JP-L1]|uniref:2Fe-2S iron-sulfur cluster-binding protein n=1 Tax=Halorubellus sp. JP-L1 TaxID=2715753 RepID=UPI001407D44E|nr:2Fe-2S iron-sulfur cluster-binding protein [Halorubellus sp. JP-L1]NHN42125.1 2Fe-2S iron-sulfur cluster binding domain-containing protein [Halorubellus sp. JP-L1]
MAVSTVGLGIGVALTVLAVVLHYARGTGWTANEDISQEVLEHRAETVPETDFPEPMNRSIGGGGVAAIGGGEAGGELAEGETEEESSSPADIPEDEVEYFDIEFAKEGETIEVANNEPLLEAGEDEGWDLPYACRQGQCVSCGGHIADGDARDFVEHDDQEMLDDPELEDGYVLTCVAYPRDDFTLETSETP